MSKTQRSTVARHGRLGRPRLLTRLLRGAGIAMAVVLVAGLGTAAYAYNDLFSSFGENAVDIGEEGVAPPDIAQLVGTEGVDILLAGLDICEWESHERFGDRCPSNPDAYGEDGREKQNGLNDVNLLVHISPEPRKITAVAFPRDLMMPTPECVNPDTEQITYAQSKAQLNSTYAAGGLRCVVSAIDSLTTEVDPELAIDYAATVTWNGVIEITNALGGVEVCVDNGIHDRHTGLNLEPGTHPLAGEQALQFLRTRHGVGDGGDLGRISNQQVYMAALARKLMSAETLTNPSTLLTLARTVVTNVDPSTELRNPATLVQLAMAANDVPLDQIVFVQYPAATDPDDPNKVVPIYAEGEKLFAAMSANQTVTPEARYGEQPGETTEPTDPPVEATEPPVETTPPTDAATPSTEPDPSQSPVEQPDVRGRNALDTSCAQGNPNG